MGVRAQSWRQPEKAILNFRGRLWLSGLRSRWSATVFAYGVTSNTSPLQTPACHLAGVCKGEVFDVTPYAKTVALHLLRNPLNQSLPRKFKIAFSGCRHDCALTPIHDIGLLAARRDDGTIGFRMSVGGGLGSAPRIGQVLREFVPMDDLIPTIEAVIKVFDTLGNRKNRHKARMNFVIEKLGFEEFKRRWEEAYVSM